jgi:hypothetical protein
MLRTNFFLSGGVGNQLFIIYAGLYFQEKSKIQTKFVYQTSGIYSFESCLTNEIDFKLPYYVEPYIFRKINLKQKLNQKLRRESRIYNAILNKYSKHYFSPNLSFDKNLATLKNKKYINGYFQTWYYYDALVGLGCPLPTLKNPSNWYREQSELAEKTFPIIMHIRRGDYLNHPKIYRSIDENYYSKAINQFSGNLQENPIWIFSDDEDYAKRIIPLLPKRNYHVINQKSQQPIEVLFLMSKGNGHIITNSTFSWWGAKISKNTEKILAPKIWFLDRETPSNLLPNDWVLI